MQIRTAIVSVLIFSLIASPAYSQQKPAEKAPAVKASDKQAEKQAVRQAEKLVDKEDRSDRDDKKLENKTAQEIADLVKDLDYPELQVVPRASDRLRMEARDEGRGWFYQHWPIQLSGLATLATATYGKSEIRTPSSDAAENASFEQQAGRVLMVGQLVGAGWLLGGVVWGLRKPYRKGLNEISKIQGKDVRSNLMRERLAEESLESPAKLVKPLRIASVVTNFAVSLLMANYLSDEGRIIAAGSAALAFVPLIYDDPTVYTWEKHQEYKRKIYGPVSSTGFGIDRASQRLVPTTTLTWNF